MTVAPTIETSRLRLRGWTNEDLEPWAQMNADPRVMEFFPQAYTFEQSAAAAATMQDRLTRDRYGWWVLEIKDGLRFAGTIALQDVPFEAPFTPAKEIGWRLARETWGCGYATEGARAALDYAFGTLGWSEVVAMTAKLNLRSQRVMQRLGMARDPSEISSIRASHRDTACVRTSSIESMLRRQIHAHRRQHSPGNDRAPRCQQACPRPRPERMAQPFRFYRRLNQVSRFRNPARFTFHVLASRTIAATNHS